jgi:hypothetical protein
VPSLVNTPETTTTTTTTTRCVAHRPDDILFAPLSRRPSGKTRRLTFIECANDLNAMIDIGKVADLVLLMIDGSFGFEMVRRLLARTVSFSSTCRPD